MGGSMRTGMGAIAGCLFILAGCDKGGGEPAGNESAPVAAASPAAAAPDRTADKGKIESQLAQIYTAQDGTNATVYPMLTQRFAVAWKDCYDLQKQVNAKEGDEGATFGECLDDAGSFIPGQDSEPGVAKRMRVADVAWTGPDAAMATVRMRLYASENAEQVVTVSMVRENGKWLVDDMNNSSEGTPGVGYRRALEEAIPKLKARL